MSAGRRRNGALTPALEENPASDPYPDPTRDWKTPQRRSVHCPRNTNVGSSTQKRGVRIDALVLIFSFIVCSLRPRMKNPGLCPGFSNNSFNFEFWLPGADSNHRPID